MSPADAFEPLRSALERAGIRYAIGGSWASTAFGQARFTNDVDILADLTEENIERFLDSLPDTFYVDGEEALTAIRYGRSFNAIYMPMAFKFDFFPAAAFALGTEELDRAIYLSDTELAKAPAPFVTRKTFCWLSCSGSGRAARPRKCSGATFKASPALAQIRLIGFIWGAQRSNWELAIY